MRTKNRLLGQSRVTVLSMFLIHFGALLVKINVVIYCLFVSTSDHKLVQTLHNIENTFIYRSVGVLSLAPQSSSYVDMLLLVTIC